MSIDNPYYAILTKLSAIFNGEEQPTNFIEKCSDGRVTGFWACQRNAISMFTLTRMSNMADGFRAVADGRRVYAVFGLPCYIPPS